MGKDFDESITIWIFECSSEKRKRVEKKGGGGSRTRLNSSLGRERGRVGWGRGWGSGLGFVARPRLELGSYRRGL